MQLTATNAMRGAAFLGAGALVATLVVTVPQEADAARPCRVKTTTSLDSSQRFAGGGILKRFSATAAGAAKGGYDQRGKIIMTSYGAGAFPSLINDKIGERRTIGSMVQAQQPQALGAINGDFFLYADIRYADNLEIPLGPMVRDGRVLRGSYQRQRVVGIGTDQKPYGGLLAVRGTVQAKLPTATAVEVRSVNWQKILDGGVNIYTGAWSNALDGGGKAYVPRPAGAVEWVLNSRNKIKTIRSSTKNTRQLGAPVADGTRVLAFSENTALGALGVPVGTKVNVNIRQSTGTGVKLFTAIGRRFPLVEAGVPAPLGCNTYHADGGKAARPRMIVGWTSTGVWRTITVPGSTFDGVGLRTGGFGLANAANLAKKLGLEYAYELDGGGSTTLWTRNTAGTWTRRDLYGVNTSVCSCERPVVNGLAFLAGP
jgi:hypothetical protein